MAHLVAEARDVARGLAPSASTARPADKRRCPARRRLRHFGWQHFTGRHNIKKCGTIAAVVNEHPESDDHHGRLVYGG
ncbi:MULTISPECIES: hypothetical protein [Streptomyces]|uniref:Transposase n=1 Tax=Streptomyces flaveolus TaxID=67297 RepID=A0ABV3AMJ6_9ACTN|nr:MULTISPECIES: hypothetical protein [Streptomyces]